MANNTNRFSTYTSASVGSSDPGSRDRDHGGGGGGGGSKNGDSKKELWSSMLDSVASGRRLPEKNLLVLGGTVDSQREFLASLAASGSHDPLHRALLDGSGPSYLNAAGAAGGGGIAAGVAPVANNFALGYTYYDVLDADHEDTLARVSMYTLTQPAPTFGALVRPLLTPQSVANTLVVVLLDWAQPWAWMRQLRAWMLLLRTVLVSLSEETKVAMEENIFSWRDRGRAGMRLNLDGTLSTSAGDGGQAGSAPGASAAGAAGSGDMDNVQLPMGPGEWEDAMGLPLCVVCQNSGEMEYLEKTQSWREEEFDVVLQFMRTVLLKHGASLIYTTPSTPSQLPSLLHASLGVHSLLKKHPLKPNVIDRDKIMVPPNWDSWSKIRVLREGFDVEQVNEGWSIDLDQPYPPRQEAKAAPAGEGEVNGTSTSSPVVDSNRTRSAAVEADVAVDVKGSTVVLYEKAVKDPTMDALQRTGQVGNSTTLEVETVDVQTFLDQQLKILDALKMKREEQGSAPRNDELAKSYGPKMAAAGIPLTSDTNNVEQVIGPVQFNMGGIQVDADDMVKRMKDRQTQDSSEPGSPDPQQGEEERPMDTENLQAFFTGLMNRKPTGQQAK